MCILHIVPHKYVHTVISLGTGNIQVPTVDLLILMKVTENTKSIQLPVEIYIYVHKCTKQLL